MQSPLPVRDGVNATRVRLPPDGPWPTVLEHLLERFDHVDPDGIADRFRRGEVVGEGGVRLTEHTPLGLHTFIWYYRELPDEQPLPVQLRILHHDEHLLVVDKPHFLPTTPGGRYVRESALVRLRVLVDNPHLVPIHRLDRRTAGVLLFSTNPSTRGRYQVLFEHRLIHKEYRAVAGVDPALDLPRTVHNRLAKTRDYLLTQELDGEPNSRTRVELLEQRASLGLYRLTPHTGKTHQLRVHMASLGLGIVNDPFYPVLQDESEDDFDRPLQLLASSIGFADPLTGEDRRFDSTLALSAYPPVAPAHTPVQTPPDIM